jgi:ADP-ribosylglycohydrolase
VSDQLIDRAGGALVAMAYGDALGGHYGFGSAALPAANERLHLLGGGLSDAEPAAWGGATQVAICVARAALREDIRSGAGLAAIAQELEVWHASAAPNGPRGIGVHTARVLHDAAALDGDAAERLRSAAIAQHASTARTAGNGALMRSVPVALALLGDAAQIVTVARSVAELTHVDPLAGDSCVLWCLVIDAAVRTGAGKLLDFVDQLPEQRRAAWTDWIRAAQELPAATFRPNGFSVTALQAAWAANRQAGTVEDVIALAVQAGDDTATVAALAATLAGARHGRRALNADRVERLHGWPDLDAQDLAELARRLVERAG